MSSKGRIQAPTLSALLNTGARWELRKHGLVTPEVTARIPREQARGACTVRATSPCQTFCLACCWHQPKGLPPVCAGSTLGSGEGARVPGHPTGVEGAAGAQCCTQGPAGLSPPAARPPQPAPSRRRLVAGCDKGSAAGGEAVAEEAAALDGSRGRLLSEARAKIEPRLRCVWCLASGGRSRVCRRRRPGAEWEPKPRCKIAPGSAPPAFLDPPPARCDFTASPKRRSPGPLGTHFLVVL